MVPDFEERQAAQQGGYTWRQWQRLPYWERVYGVAHLRARRLVDMHNQDAQDRETQRQQRRANRRR